MKTYSLKTVSFLLCSVLLFSSCLKDDDNSIERSRDLALITNIGNTKCAVTICGYLTSPQIQSLQDEKCYIIGYKISNPVTGGFNTPDVIENVSVLPLQQTDLKNTANEVETEYNYAVDDLVISIFYPTSYMKDRWLFRYSASMNADEILVPYFYYNADNQVDKNGDNIKNRNMVVIDVYFKKVAKQYAETIYSPGVNAYYTVANLSSLRGLYLPDYSKGTTSLEGRKVDVQLLFRYHKKGSGNTSSVAYVGNWDTFSRVYMTYFVPFID